MVHIAKQLIASIVQEREIQKEKVQQEPLSLLSERIPSTPSPIVIVADLDIMSQAKENE